MSAAIPDMQFTEAEDTLRNAEYREGLAAGKVLSEPFIEGSILGFSCRLSRRTLGLLHIRGGVVQNTFVPTQKLNLRDALLNAPAGEILVYLAAVASFPVRDDGASNYRGPGPSAITAGIEVYNSIPTTSDTDGLVYVRRLLCTLRFPANETEEAAAVLGIYMAGGAGIDSITLPPLGGRD